VHRSHHTIIETLQVTLNVIFIQLLIGIFKVAFQVRFNNTALYSYTSLSGGRDVVELLNIKKSTSTASEESDWNI